MKSSIIYVILGVIIFFVGCNSYNGMIKKNEGVNSKWAIVESSYQRRADLIPNLVSTVKGEATFEQSTLTGVIEARAKATQIKIDPKDLTAEKLQEFQAAQGQLSQALGRLMMVSEQYPSLKANEGFRNLQAQLEGTENRINVARNDFNNEVQSYNTSVGTFPGIFFSKLFGFKARDYFKSQEGNDKAPEVKF